MFHMLLSAKKERPNVLNMYVPFYNLHQDYIFYLYKKEEKKIKMISWFFNLYMDMLRSIRGFFIVMGNGTMVWQRGHLGSFFDIST